MNSVAVRYLNIGEGFNPAPIHLSLETAIESEALPNMAKSLYCHIVRLAMQRGYAWPSLNYLCNSLNKSRSTVKRAIRALEKAGYIAVIRPQGKALSKHKSCLYVILWQDNIRKKLQALNRRVLRVSVSDLMSKMNPRPAAAKIDTIVKAKRIGNSPQPQSKRGVNDEPSHIDEELDIKLRGRLPHKTKETQEQQTQNKNKPFTPDSPHTKAWIDHFAPKTAQAIMRQETTLETVIETINVLAMRGDPTGRRPYTLLRQAYKMPDCKMRRDLIDEFPYLKAWIEKEVI